MKIYHQLGYQEKWNFESYYDDNVGDGFIFSPCFMERAKMEEMPVPRKQISLFDPQFFLPNSAKRHLATYPFFPSLAVNGFATTAFPNEGAKQTAEECIKWQRSNQFDAITIPTRYEPGMPSGFIDQQSSLFVNPFLDVLASHKIGISKLLQIVVNDHMLLDEPYFASLLNWISGLPEITGVYLIIAIEKRPKQLTSIDLLVSLLKFIDALRQNEFDVIIGYTNTEAFLLSVADPTAVTVGSYENTRMFNIRNFEEVENKQKGGPNARLYSTELLQWIDHNYLSVIRRLYSKHNSLFEETDYRLLMFEPTYQWHFGKPELYKHYFQAFSRQLRSLAPLHGQDRWAAVRDHIQSARNIYQELSDSGIAFDPESSSNHLGPWLTAINEFGKLKGWA